MKLAAAFLGAMFFSVPAFAQVDLTISSLDTVLVSTDFQTLRISCVLRAMLTNVGTAAGLVGILGSAEHVDPMAVGAKPVVLIPLTGIVAFRQGAE